MFDLKCIDCREGLKEIPDNSIDMCLTDPPYGLDGLDETWDAEIIEKKKPKSGDKAVISNLPVGMKFDPKQGQNFQNFYKPICDEIYRVLKPGGFFLTFSQARLYHHAAIAVENSGFEVRDMLGWIYTKSTQGKAFGQDHLIDINAELSKEEKDAAKKICKGWKTPQLKPAIEPIYSYIGSVNLNNLKNIEHADLNANCATEIEKSQSRFHKLSDNQKVEKTCQHLKYTCEIFNKYAETLNLMMRLDCTEIVNDIQRQWKRKQIAPEVRAYCDGRSSKGILHENELNALANITFELEHNIIPIILALGKTLCPMYLGTHLLSQTASMKESQNTFRKIYQNIEVRHIKNKEAMKLSEYNIDTYIENLITNEKTINDKNLQSLINDDIMIDDKTNKETYENLSVHATIQTYHDRVLQQLLKDNYYTYDNAFNAINKIHTRTASHDKKSEFQNVYKNIIAADCHIFLIIDEPQYGPTITGVMSDWLDCFKKDTNGDIIYDDDKNPVINPDSIFQQILDYNTHNRCIAFSATGYELFHRKDIKTIKLKLSELYSGFNWYYGDVFDKDVNITPPTVYAVSDVLHSLASQNGNDPLIKFLHHFSRAIYYSKNREKYAKKIKSLNRKLKKLGIPEYTGNWESN